MSAVPHYVTIDDRQMRVWRAGAGPSLVVLPGLAVGAAVTAARLAAICPGWSITAIELPGTAAGRSACRADGSPTIATTAEALGLERSVLVAIDLAIALADDVARRLAPAATILVGEDTARAWAARVPSLASLAPRRDGAHLTALFAHLRDLEILEPSDRSRPARQGGAYLDAGRAARRRSSPGPPIRSAMRRCGRSASPNCRRPRAAGAATRCMRHA